MVDMRQLVRDSILAADASDLSKRVDKAKPKISTPDQVKPEQLQNALDTYAKGCKAEDIILLCDVHNKGFCGYIFTEDCLYGCDYYSAKGDSSTTIIRYKDYRGCSERSNHSQELCLSDVHHAPQYLHISYPGFMAAVLDNIMKTWANDIIVSHKPERDKVRFPFSHGMSLIVCTSAPYYEDRDKDQKHALFEEFELDFETRKINMSRGTPEEDSWIEIVQSRKLFGEYIGFGRCWEYESEKIIDFNSNEAIVKELKHVPVGSIVTFYEVDGITYLGMALGTTFVGKYSFIDGKPCAAKTAIPDPRAVTPDIILTRDNKQICDPDEITSFIDRCDSSCTFNVRIASRWTTEENNYEKLLGKDTVVLAEQDCLEHPLVVWHELTSDGKEPAFCPEQIFASIKFSFPDLGEQLSKMTPAKTNFIDLGDR